MKQLCLLLFPLFTALLSLAAPGDKHISIETQRTALVIRIDKDQTPTIVHLGPGSGTRLNMRLYQQTASGVKIIQVSITRPTPPPEAAICWNRAIQVTHADGNPSLDLKYIRHDSQKAADGTVQTNVYLKDPQYPFEVTLHYKAYPNEDVIEQWSTIRHSEKKPVILQKYASANLYIPAQNYYLTHFHGDWANEMNPSEVPLTEGLKVLDSKLGTRADLFQPPSFLVSLNQPADEDRGDVIAGTLAWSGNYQLAFEVDPLHNLRIVPGINPYASAYSLAPGKEFTTPAFLFTYSQQGTGGASRSLHRWARTYRIPQGKGNRLTLLNNWEATYFDFNEQKLSALIKDGKKLGVDLFLLDDGWFGNKYPRNNDHTSLGDWQENAQKLPHGLGYLVKEAESAGIKFGIWLEPEMVSPKSELYEKHPDWVIKLPNRQEYYFRNQLVLDLSNPKVQDFVYEVVNGIMTKNPTLSYIKWDCNAVIYNAYSTTNPNQSNLYVDYVQGLYKVLERLRTKYLTLPMMLCSGGGGRVDYGALRYFTEYWPSDNTDGLERVFIQWNYSYLFPSIASCNHVTDWGKQPLKFRTDVAMMGKLGYDIVVSKLSEPELQFSQQALKDYDRLKSIIWQGDQFRLASPYTNDVASVMYVSEGQDRAVWFTYLTKNRYKAGSMAPIKLKGLNPDKTYKVQELNVYPGTKSAINTDTSIYSGNYLMTIGFNPQVDARRTSVVLEVMEAK